jgi:RNA polymerase sigma-70 factor (ECF subfamily)
MDEAEIISRCLKGDGSAFEMVVNRYQSQLLHFTWSILGDKDEAKDVTQESFVNSYLHLKSFDQKRSFKSWLYTIAYNRCMDKIRERKARIRFIQKVKNEQGLNRQLENPEKGLEDSEHFLLILKRLNVKERTALSLKLNEGYLAREIAEILGCKESTVRVYILNAKRKLMKYLENKRNV